MIRQVKVFVTALIILTGCTSCHKEEQETPLVGTSWECSENGTLLVFNDNKSGLYYCKSSTDDVYDSIFSSFNFTYTISGNNITIQVSLTKRTFVMDGIIDGELLTTNGTIDQRHYFKIPHKMPI